jgi:hypothetical protein
MTRWMHPPERGNLRERDHFDPVAEGARYQLSRELSLELWERAVADATDSAGRCDRQAAQRRFHELASNMAARGGRVRPDVGRLTRGDGEPERTRHQAWRADARRGFAPGRENLVDAEARRRARTTDVSEMASNDSDGAIAEREMLGGDAVYRRGSLRSLQRPDQPVPIDPSLGERMSRLFHFDLSKIEVVPASSIAGGATRAVTKDGQVHFAAGAYQPGTPEGDRLIAHELAHVVQLFGGRGERAGSRKELEREADRAANRVAMGKLAPIALRADAGAAYAFSEGEDHGEPLDTHDDEKTGDERDEKTGDERDEKTGDERDEKTGKERDDKAADERDDKQEDPKAAPDKGHPDANAAGEQPADDHDAHDDVIDPGDLAEASAQVPAEAGGGGPGVPGGGGAPAKPQKEPPSVAGGKPEVGLAQLQGVRPDKLGPVFGQLHTAAGADVAKARAEQQANPPKQMSTGGPATAKAAKGKDGTPTADGDADAAKKELPDHPVKAEVPGGEADKQAKQGQATEQQRTAGQVITNAAQSIASWFGSWIGGGASNDPNTVKMSEAETRQMSGSLDNLPTTASDISTDAGPPPELKMKGEARSSADKDRADLETKTSQLENQGRTDARVPMGEDHIETTVATEELTAAAVPGGAMPEAALPTVADAAATEEVGFVAQEQSGAEIDAALAKASTDVGAERSKQAEEEAKARADSDNQIRDLKTTADADQEAARTSAKAEVEQARGEWQGEIDKKGADARKQADKKVSEGMTQVEAEETKANTEAKQHVDEGKRKADEEKQKGEKEAADAKDKGKEKSSGFFGWLSSKAKAFFDGIKKAVSAAIDACRKAVKAVIDAAKKLAMAAIELARKAIVAAIKLVGEALIAISNVLLAAFPELKAKFQNAIRKTVDKAVDAVNKLADGLKKAVQKALDLLGAALDKALQLLEKGINAVIDAANAVVQGAIKAAQAVVEMLGQWAKLIKDIASGPGAWIKNLGAAILDGIKNHLWSAFKTAVVEWFKAKVFELLGVGGIVLQLLLEGGLTRENIIQMALDALIVAIPAALIMILIEKLVAMIVPAAGAIIAIIEGLQAAWGTISRIIAAFAAFMAFLLAVKAGGAGPLFATVLASAAVVVLDFVANWLLKKLMSAARKVGAKLKSMAEKFKAKRKAKKDAKAAKNAKQDHDGPGGPGRHKKDHDGPDGPNGKKKKDKDDGDQAKSEKDKKKKEEKDKKNQEILAKAQRELPPKIQAALKKRPGKLMFRARLTAWRIQYRLTSLQMIESGDHFKIKATVNPSAELDGGFVADVIAMLREIGDRLLRENPAALKRAADRAAGMDIDLDSPNAQRAYAPRSAEERLAVAADQKKNQPNRDPWDRTLVDHGDVKDGGHTRSAHDKIGYKGDRVQGDEFVRPINPDGKAGQGRSYEKLAKELEDRGITPKQLGEAMRAMSNGFAPPSTMRGSEKELGELMGLFFGTEASRDSPNALFSMMAIEQMERGGKGTTITGVMTALPAEMKGHVRAAEGQRADMEGEDRTHRHKQPKIDELARRQMAQLEAWFKLQTGGRELVTASVAELKTYVEEMVRRFISTYMP